MPKVKDEYLQGKREEVLGAAYRVCMQKPVYSITMRDIIAETGWSQGTIYRYFKNVHDILFELINRQTAHLHVKEEVDAILSLPELPEQIIAKTLDLVTRTSMMNIKEFGKMFFEYTALIVEHPEYLDPFTQKVKMEEDLQYLQKRILTYIVLNIESGYFKPLIPIEDIFAFIETSIDGIQRDIILHQCYELEVYSAFVSKKLDPQKLMNALCKSVIYLLGGNPDKETKMNYKDKAIHCVKDTILPMQREQFEACGRCLDEQYRRYGNTPWLSAKTIEEGRVYEIGYPKCVCPEVASGKATDVSHCECSRQSVLYIIGELLPDKNISVEIIETVLGGAEKCRFKVIVE